MISIFLCCHRYGKKGTVLNFIKDSHEKPGHLMQVLKIKDKNKTVAQELVVFLAKCVKERK